MIYTLFFQKYWEVLKPSVIDLCCQAFDSGSLPEGINDTYLCLIPKFSNANNLKNFRPIGLCNTIYKVITKTIANRLKPYLSNIIGPQQASFIKGRRTCDNAIII